MLRCCCCCVFVVLLSCSLLYEQSLSISFCLPIDSMVECMVSLLFLSIKPPPFSWLSLRSHNDSFNLWNLPYLFPSIPVTSLVWSRCIVLLLSPVHLSKISTSYRYRYPSNTNTVTRSFVPFFPSFLPFQVPITFNVRPFIDKNYANTSP